MNSFLRISCLATLAIGLQACSSVEPLQAVDKVDLGRFMGDWYVIANIPTSIEKGAHNAIETYQLEDDGTIATTFKFRADSFDGELKTYNPRGFVMDDSNAIWGMQFIWPIKADYRIIYLEQDYSVTVIGRNKRDYVWIMARSPVISEQKYAAIIQQLVAVGYDSAEIQKVPQKW